MPQLPSDGSCGVIVSEDGTSSPSLPDSVTRLRGPGRGAGANRNFAAAHSVADWLIFVDDDCLPEPGFLAAHLSGIKSVSGGKPVVFFGKTILGEGPHDSLLWEAPSYSEDQIIPPSCNFAILRSLMNETGGFDERFRYMFEDTEFFARLRLSGVEFHYLPGAVVVHPMRRVPSAAKLAARWESRVFSTHDLGATSLEIFLLFSRHVAAVILSRFRNPKNGRDRLHAAFLFFAEYLHFLVRLPRWVWTVKKSPRSAFWERMVAAGKAPPRFGL